MARKNRIDYIVLACIMGVALAMRLKASLSISLNNDELSSWARSTYPTFREVIQKGILTDGHPPFTYLFLHTWILFFGDSVWALHIPFIIASCGSIFMIYALGARWFSRPAGLCAAAVVAVSTFGIYYGFISRPYAFGQLFLMLTIYFGESWRVVGKRVVTPARVLFIVCAALCCLTHYFCFMGCVIYCIVLFIYTPGKQRIGLVAAGVAIILLLLPFSKIYLTQIGYGGLEWVGRPNMDFLHQFYITGFNNDDKWMLVIAAIVLLGFMQQKLTLTFAHVVCITCVVVSYLAGYYKSVLGTPLLVTYCMYFVWPLFLLFIFSLLPQNIPVKKYLFSCSLLALLILGVGARSTIVRKQFYTTEHHAEFKKLAYEIDTLVHRYPLDSTLCIANFNNIRYIRYYLDKIPLHIPFVIYRCDDDSGLMRIAHAADSAHAKYLLYTWSNIYFPPATDSVIRSRYPKLLYRSHHIDSDVRLYTR